MSDIGTFLQLMAVTHGGAVAISAVITWAVMAVRRDLRRHAVRTYHDVMRMAMPHLPEHVADNIVDIMRRSRVKPPKGLR